MNHDIVDQSKESHEDLEANDHPKTPEEIFALIELNFVKDVLELDLADRVLSDDEHDQEENDDETLDSSKRKPEALSFVRRTLPRHIKF